MPRLVNGERKIINPKPEHVGKLLIFCEGTTEYNYLSYFKKYLDSNKQNKYSDVVLEIEPIDTGGNAKHVFEFAEKFLSENNNSSKYFYYEKHLVFDCDAPENIQEIIQLMMNSDNDYFLDYSNLLFETWLVMHFQDILPNEKNDKRKIIQLIRNYLEVDYYNSKIKASKGTIGKILGSNGNQKIRAAIENAKKLDQHWKSKGLMLQTNIKEMNPSVEIYKLIERLLDEVILLCS